MIYSRAAENAEKFGIFRLSLRRRQTKTIMPSAIGSHIHLARRVSVYSFSPFSAKRNKKNLLRELSVSNELLVGSKLGERSLKRMGGETKYYT